MADKEGSELISSKFINEFVFRLLEAKNIRNSYENKKNKLILHSNLPPTGNDYFQIEEIEEKNKTSSYFKSIVSEDIENIIESSNPRILIHPIDNPRIRKPIANYVGERKYNMSMPAFPQNQQSINALSLDKLKTIFSDPGVMMVECRGPDTPLVISRRGFVSTSNVVLTEEEINDFMKDVSQKTRIPLIAGLFKALLGNFLINAVVSEFVGIKLIIRRR